jgi:hypothetical protein
MALESKNANQETGVPGLKMRYYPSSTIRWSTLLVKEKAKKRSSWGFQGDVTGGYGRLLVTGGAEQKKERRQSGRFALAAALLGYVTGQTSMKT